MKELPRRLTEGVAYYLPPVVVVGAGTLMLFGLDPLALGLTGAAAPVVAFAWLGMWVLSARR